MVNKKNPQRSGPKTGKTISIPVPENIVPIAILGFSVLTLGLSVYGINSGHVAQYAANHKASQTVYASPAESVQQNTIGSVASAEPSTATRSDVQSEQDLRAQEEAIKIEAEKLAQEHIAAEKAEAEAKAAEAEKQEAEAAKSMRLRKQPDRDTGGTYYYVVESGDTLADLAVFFNLPIGQLMEENFVNEADTIYVGEVLFMPIDYVPSGG